MVATQQHAYSSGTACCCFILFITIHIQLLFVVPAPMLNAGTFQDEFDVTWGFDHVTTSSDGQALWLMLDNSSGSSMASKRSYLFGSVSMEMKLIPQDSAGVVTAYYMASTGNAETRDELDFEFLGNQSGEPYILQSNVYARGTGGREQRINLWFDPTQDFHAYSFSWTPHHILFMVDEVPIRVFKNGEKYGVPYLNTQAMGIYSSIWNGDEWATQGEVSECKGFPNPSWGSPSSLTASQLADLERVKQSYMVYDYCTDSSRYKSAPTECSFNP
ncbi:hypothetical protein GOP47_0004855 [Adiantum capillus-veneris]|uniref:Xyloglucan endotransglucosylase/hydrolase n=1 Tax=Adiantum capillus-veneris TaxID=13818 RepID=A0A9D4ZN32_ADICA|nr:hypothetical protein GOP47_0004855 [Adiantum capillus-veneris]